jgi:Major intrinsic protein
MGNTVDKVASWFTLQKLLKPLCSFAASHTNFLPLYPPIMVEVEHPSLGASAEHLTLHASAPQTVRIGGLVGTLARLAGELDLATCDFGAADVDEGEDVVQCRCDAKNGTMECEVPPSRGMVVGGDNMHVKAKIADQFETPIMYFNYNVDYKGRRGGHDERDVVIYGHQNDFSPEEVKALKSSLQVRALKKLSGARQGAIRSQKYTIFQQCIAEAVGTGLIVIFGVGSVCSAVLTGYNNGGLWPVAVVWGFGVALAIGSTVCLCMRNLLVPARPREPMSK